MQKNMTEDRHVYSMAQGPSSGFGPSPLQRVRGRAPSAPKVPGHAAPVVGRRAKPSPLDARRVRWGK